MNLLDQLLIHLTIIQGIGPVTIHRLLERVLPNKDELLEIYCFTVSQFQEKFQISQRSAQLLVKGLSERQEFDEEMHLITKNSIKVITFFNDQYPDQLKKITVPPVLLYIRGALSWYTRFFSIVGSRQASAYAQQVISNFVPYLANLQCTIVSGGARGADAMAHKATLKAGGITYAVLGSGLLNCYPAEHDMLFQDIIDNGGALISPFSLRTVPLAGNFPARNRIIAGLSDACLVVQAMEKSGARITAQYTLDQAKEVFVIPGLIYDPLSVGCHQLVKEGAHLVTGVADITEIMYNQWAIKNDEVTDLFEKKVLK